jgi:hypothetical protein
MLSRLTAVALWSCLALVASGCSGGGSSASASQGPCLRGGSNTLCLVSCNLGCSLQGCTVTEIAQNLPIVLRFNQNIDPASLSTSSFSLRTASGEEPVGQYFVSGNTAMFVPEIRIIGGASFFGFEANETYTLTLPGGTNSLNVLRSTSGDPFGQTTTCNLAVTRGIIDLDNAPPVAKLLSPTATTDVDPQTPIVLEFSEIIDVTPFLQTAVGNEAVRVLARKTQLGTTGEIICDTKSPAASVAGTWNVTNDALRQVSTATFNPAHPIPNGVCIVVDVTTAVRDLSGRPSMGQIFTYMVTAGAGTDESIVETFTSDLNFDANASSGTWINGAQPGVLGWDGLHGDFSLSIAKSVSQGVFELSTDNQMIPARQTLSGRDEMVTDGVFRFARLIVPEGVTVRFAGTNPARVYVRGIMQIDGVLDVAGESRPAHEASLAVGQAGGKGGPGAGRGGDGAAKGDNLGNKPAFNGKPGEAIRLPMLSATAMAGGGSVVAAVSEAPLGARPDLERTGVALPRAEFTGGRGSLQFPRTGMSSSVKTNPVVAVAAGGGGGGYHTSGQGGVAINTTLGGGPTREEDLGPPALGGEQIPLFPIPAGKGIVEHFLIGGSGGGGGGSHLYGTIPQALVNWRSGGGGGGGGGALSVRVGRDLAMGAAGLIDASGGDTANSTIANNYAAPGGGGSGGTIILQSASTPRLDGVIDVRGGVGGTLSEPVIVNMLVKAGDGGTGYARVEAPGPVPADVTAWTGTVQPAATSVNVGELTEQDPVSGVQSQWYLTGALFPPIYDRYEIEATVDGVPITYNDATSIAAVDTPVQFFVQGANEDGFGSVELSTVAPWRRFVAANPNEPSLATDGTTAFRFVLLFDRSQATQIVVHKVSVFFRQF